MNKSLAVCGIFFAAVLTLSCAGKSGTNTEAGYRMTQKDIALKQRLTPLQYNVTQAGETEPSFVNEYWDNREEGLYVDIVSGIPLFSSEDKFDSGSGWPSFTKPIDNQAVYEKGDSGNGVLQNEVRSTVSDSHLGHVFDDGPTPTGLRYCINSAALRFISEKDLEREGYGAYRPETGQQAAIFAAGCFWGTEGYFRQLPGVLITEVGYSGGYADSPNYESVSTGATGHAESILIFFDPSRIAYADLVRHFFRMHDPTELNRQGNDIGTQYRSAIFAVGEDQRAAALSVLQETEAAYGRGKPIVTEIRAAGPFFAAETYHQDYLEKNPNGYCHVDLDLARKPLSVAPLRIP